MDHPLGQFFAAYQAALYGRGTHGLFTHVLYETDAFIDTIRADGFSRVTVWVNSTDDVLRAFYTEAGWAPDGAHRELDLYGDESVRIKQIRLHTDPGSDD